jgi:RNA polymerase sigma factor (sigma-70 family)
MKTNIDYSETIMVKGILNKNDKAFNTFCERFSRHIYNECLKSTGDRDEAYDLLNEILLKCFSGMGTYDYTKSMLSTWVINIAKNYLRNFIKAKPA